ncbi:MAG TPA: ABC transporter substrate-binding protein [Kofleriaceae bacterium]|nr:ABC transporter substrate-binding protein [Kofleriaceae bacterium]
MTARRARAAWPAVLGPCALGAALGVALALAPAGTRAESRPRYGSQIEATLLGAPVASDPQAAQTHAELTVAELVFDTLYRAGPFGGAAPHLAAGPPQLDAARTTATIEIRPHVRFHDGAPLTASDVVASLERLRTGAGSWLLPGVTAIRVLTGDSLELTLRAPVPDLELLLSMPQTAVTKGGRPPQGHVGSGAFRVEVLDPAKKLLRLRAFDDHFAGRPYLEQLELRWYDTPDGEARRFESGAAQVSARGPGALATSVPLYREHVVEGPAALLLYVGFGAAHPELGRSVEVRRAIDLALARDPLKSVTSGERVAPAREPVPAEAGGVAPTPAARGGDPAAAQAQLAAAARTIRALEPASRSQLELEILIEDTRPDDRELANYVAYALHGLGLRSKITALPGKTFRARTSLGQADLWIGQVAMPIASAPLWWAAAFAAGGDVAAATAAAAGTLDAAAARQQFERKLPILPLLFRAVRLWHRTDVRGLKLDASGRPSFADVFMHGQPVRSKTRP